MLVLASSCRRAATPSSESVPKDRVSVKQTDQPKAKSPSALRQLSDQQRQALDAISAVGGNVARAASGCPTAIDLASDRVFANETLVRAVLAFPHLKTLRLAVTTVSLPTLRRLQSLTELRTLFLQDGPFTDDDLGRLLRAMPELRHLGLRRVNGVSDAVIKLAAKCSKLEVLDLIEMPQITGKCLSQLKTISKLRALDLRNCGQLVSGDFAKLTALEQLQDLKIGGPAVDDDALRAILPLRHLVSLTVEDAGITGDALHSMAEDAKFATRLRSLAFARCFGVTDESLSVLPKFTNLRSFALREIMVTGEFLALLSQAGQQLPHLKSLTITGAFLTDDKLTLLPRIAPNLERLDLRGNAGITGTARAILKQIPTLKQVQLDGGER